MANQNVSSYLAPYACALPANTKEHKALQTELFATIRDPNASEAAKNNARFHVLCLNIRMVLKIALKFKEKVTDLEDLLQVGQMALYKAMESFDPAYGVLLISYAGLGIERAMERSISDNMEDDSPFYVPAFRSRQMGKVKFAMGELTKEGGDVHDVQAILAKIHARPEKTSKAMTEEHVIACLKVIKDSRTVKLNASSDQSDGQSKQLVEMTPSMTETPEETTFNHRAEGLIRRRCGRIQEVLPLFSAQGGKMARDANIIRLRYGLDGKGQRTLDESGRPFDLTRERARQVIEAMFKKLGQATGMTATAVEEALEAYAEGILRMAA